MLEFVIILGAIIMYFLFLSKNTNSSNEIQSDSSHNIKANDSINSKQTNTNNSTHRSSSFTSSTSVAVSVIKQAISKNSKLQITYQTNDYQTKAQETTIRIITPINIYYENDNIYLKAYCHLRQAERNFKINRIKQIEIV